jgi:hypothetical protein
MSQLTRSIKDRLFVGLLSAVFVACFGFLLADRFEKHDVPHDPAPASDWVWDVFSFLLSDLFLVVFVGSVFGVVWAIFTPDWLERLLKKVFLRFLLLILLFSFVVMGMLLWSFPH